MNLMNEVKEILTNTFSDADVVVNDLTGTEDHLELIIASDDFKGKPLLAQHRLVMDALKEKLQDKLHAVKIKTQTKTS